MCRRFFHGALACAVLMSPPLRAQAPPHADADNHWQFALTPYLWLPNVSGSLRFALPDNGGADASTGPYRIQIVKGWLDRRGELQEKVYDVVSSDKRTPGADGKLPAVGNTVDELITVWRNPDFDAGLRAFYYARVIEIPTPRWTAYDAKYFKIKMPPEVPMTIQERAYTSPIWYTPRS